MFLLLNNFAATKSVYANSNIQMKLFAIISINL